MKPSRAWPLWRELLIAAALVVGMVLLSFFVFSQLRYDWNWSSMAPYWKLLAKGMLLTVMISIGALVVSFVVGALLAAAQLSRSKALRWSARAYVELIRGTPLLVLLLVGYYVVAQAFGLDSEFLIGVLLLSCFAGAYLAEILRGGVESVSASQLQAAAAVGFDQRQTFRFVILPQALRSVLPAITGQLVSLVKDSSLLSVIGISEFTYQIRIANAATYNSLEGFIPLAIGYLVLTLPIGAVAAWMERRLRYAD